MTVRGPGTHPKSEIPKTLRLHDFVFGEFAGTFAFFPLTRVRNPTEMFQKDFFRSAFLFWVDFFRWISSSEQCYRCVGLAIDCKFWTCIPALAQGRRRQDPNRNFRDGHLCLSVSSFCPEDCMQASVEVADHKLCHRANEQHAN